MSDNYAQDAVTITRAEYDALIAGIKRIGERELTERLTLESENPDLGALQGEINGLVDQLDAHLAEDRDATMNLALAMSEYTENLEFADGMISVRDGNASERLDALIARVVEKPRYLDRILVMQAGRVIEDGRHDQLLAQGGVYAQLYRRQFVERRFSEFPRFWTGWICATQKFHSVIQNEPFIGRNG